MSNYQPNGTATGRLINQGVVYQSPTPDDEALWNQQVKYANLCVQFISTAGPFIRNGKNVTNEIQTHLTILSQSVPMTTASAQAYFAGVTVTYWSASVVDWLAGYNAITSYVFV